MIPFFSGEVETEILGLRSFSCLKECKLITKGCLYHIVRVRDLESEVHLIESVPVVKELL